jgi:hypothetical protein
MQERFIIIVSTVKKRLGSFYTKSGKCIGYVKA